MANGHLLNMELGTKTEEARLPLYILILTLKNDVMKSRGA